ncbi:MAG: tetratricopeptide repeat protein [Lysobacterales bacterium]|nr:MAG: tetratricopeptide repeat protein [Xanthomonadales bacterium]
MTTFLILCAVMIVAALVLVLVPLLRRDPATMPGQPERPRSVPAAVAVMVTLPLAASALYGLVSNWPWEGTAAALAGAGHGEDGGSMDEATAALAERLRKNPADLEGWRMLGRSYLMTGRPAEAIEAYERASSIAGAKDLGIELDLAEAVVLAGDAGRMPRAKSILDGALEADASNQKALWYAGLLALRADDVETAKARWGRLLEANPPEEIRRILVNQLQQLGVEVPGEAPPAMVAAAPAGAGPVGGMGGMGGGGGGGAVAAEPAGRTVRVAVSVAPDLLTKLKPGTAVFVSAREAGIPGPPLAAVRLSTDELPTTVILSDANSMVEGRNLSAVDEVQVVARVAFGGTAVPASGDLLGEARHSKGAAADVAIVIDKVAP